jgi:histidinol-phosphate phosphatase family protein
MMAVDFDIVIPTIGRASLGRCIGALAREHGPLPGRVIVVDDRRVAEPPISFRDDAPFLILVVRSHGRGPAAARNAGWTRSHAQWIAFLDDDVVPFPGWRAALASDLEGQPSDVAGSQGHLTVPAAGSPRTDWERNVAQLETADWITADIAYRRSALADVGGFDERFPRAYREDVDIALQVLARGARIVRGRRRVEHPVPPADWRVSIRKQVGNVDDALMRRRYGASWREKARTAPSRLGAYAASTLFLVAAALGTVTRRRVFAATGAFGWAAMTARFAAQRLRNGPRTASEMATMVATSAVIPVVALTQRARGEMRVFTEAISGLPPERRITPHIRPRAVLFDRDGTLVHDVPFNGDPEAVQPITGAREAVARLRAAGLDLAVITNQSGVARGLITMQQVRAVNARVDAEVGPISHWFVCPHDTDAGCDCRKPAAGLVRRAAERLRVAPHECVVIGDTGADVGAARAAGARAVLVPNPKTRGEEIAAASDVAPDLQAAVDMIVGS